MAMSGFINGRIRVSREGICRYSPRVSMVCCNLLTYIPSTQRSLVILSHLAYPSLFAAVLEIIAPIYFSHGYPALEAACYGIASWYVLSILRSCVHVSDKTVLHIRPDPDPGAILELPLLTEILTVKLPEMNEAPQMHTKRADSEAHRPSVVSLVLILRNKKQIHDACLFQILASLPAVSPLRVFSGFLPSLWHVWECLVLGEPLLVIAPDPKTCSDIVWWMRDLIRPVGTSHRSSQ